MHCVCVYVCASLKMGRVDINIAPVTISVGIGCMNCSHFYASVSVYGPNARTIRPFLFHFCDGAHIALVAVEIVGCRGDCWLPWRLLVIMEIVCGSSWRFLLGATLKLALSFLLFLPSVFRCKSCCCSCGARKIEAGGRRYFAVVLSSAERAHRPRSDHLSISEL